MQIHRAAFTLIELLIVVAIIAILAAIAVPNFLEAQTRAKVSRAKAEMRVVAGALEAYAADWGRHPPNDGQYNVLPIQITSPIAYIASARLVDPFADKERHLVHGELARFYTYTYIVSYDEFRSGRARPAPPIEGIDGPNPFNTGALGRYGRWRLVSLGPDRKYAGSPPWQSLALKGSDCPYDPSNGSVSAGNILRTQRSPAGPDAAA